MMTLHVYLKTLCHRLNGKNAPDIDQEIYCPWFDLLSAKKLNKAVVAASSMKIQKNQEYMQSMMEKYAGLYLFSLRASTQIFDFAANRKMSGCELWHRRLGHFLHLNL
jgi:hypothetical protein